MITASELVATATIWGLMGIGGFFGMRRPLRSRKTARSGRKQPVGKMLQHHKQDRHAAQNLPLQIDSFP